MIIVTAQMMTRKGQQATFIKNAQACIHATRKESGNLSYVLQVDTEDDCKFTFLEEWESPAALDLHMNTAHFHQLIASLEGVLSEPPVVKVYEANKIQ